MKFNYLMLSIFFALANISYAFAQSTAIPKNVTIARDSFGVPHIFGKTDADVAYGLAWAHSEDDFKNIQYNLLAGKNMLGRVLGKDGVLFDFGLQFLNIDSFVEKNYDKDVSPEYKKIIEAYIHGINDYAATHPKEVINKKALPFTVKDAMKSAVLQTSLMAGVGMALKSIRDGKIREFYTINDVGSNAMAIAPSKTTEGKTYLAINSHQPIEGRFAWYEAHLCSEEGWDIIGGLFPGGATIFVGSNHYLGWAHTTNYHTFGDIYKIEVNPDNKNQYKYDGAWKNFGLRTAKLKVKIAGLKIPVKKKILLTEYGPTYKTKDGLYAIRFPSYTNMKATEQWYKMNKAKNFKEFEEAVKIEAVPLFNIVYGDVDGNVYLHSGGIIPKRDPSLDWTHPIPGTSSKYRWTELVSYEEKPTVLNPDCGFVYNCNQSPLFGAGEDCEWRGDFVGLHRFQMNRGERFKRLLEGHQGKFNWADFNRIKFDKAYDDNPKSSYRSHMVNLYNLDEKKYPAIADAIQQIKKWDFNGNTENRSAALALVTHDYLIKKLNVPFAFLMIGKENLSESLAVEGLTHARKFLIKHYGSVDVSLGTVQRHIRGNVSIPASGLREVARAADGKLYDKKKGIYKVVNGDGYIQMTKFSKGNLPEIFTINAYGSSAHEDSLHYTDQMNMFQNEQFKTMTFDKATILKNAERVYQLGR